MKLLTAHPNKKEISTKQIENTIQTKMLICYKNLNWLIHDCLLFHTCKKYKYFCKIFKNVKKLNQGEFHKKTKLVIRAVNHGPQI